MSNDVGKVREQGAEEDSDGRRVAGAETRARLLEAAVDLVATDGPSGLTVRAVSRAAGANVAAVKYHFGSRDGLVAAVVASISEPIVKAQREGLAALENAPTPPTPREWVEAWGRPLVRASIDQTDLGLRLGRLVKQGLAEPQSPLEDALREVVAETDERLIAGLQQSLPELPEATLRLRLAVMVSVVTGFTGGAFEPHLARAQPENRLEDRLVELLVGLSTDPDGEPGVGD